MTKGPVSGAQSLTTIATLTDLAIATESYPAVIFLDAVGTLFGVKDDVGTAYQAIAQQFQVEAPATALNRAFFAAFQAAPSMAFPALPTDQIAQAEYDWWAAIARQTFAAVGVLDHFADFEAFFQTLYAHFATAAPWFVYEDVVPALQHWRSQGVRLGVVSNFDRRLYPVLTALGLAEYFDTVTISTEVGAAKPHAAIFHAAIAKQGCDRQDAWHIGDSRQMDYDGAHQAGLYGIWLNR